VAEDDFDQAVEVVANGSIVKMFRMLHGKLGRYPTFAEMHPPGSPVMGGSPSGEQSHG